MMGRDPVDIAELQRDYEETYGTDMQREEERFNHELDQADILYGEDNG